MIVRGCCDPIRVIGAIQNTNYLGRMDNEALEELNRHVDTVKFIGNPEAGRGNMDSATSIFGFFLPSGIHLKPSTELDEPGPYGWRLQMEEVFVKFNNIEEVYKQYFNLSDDELLLEKDQVAYFEVHPDKCPE